MKITKILAREIYDSRGWPTVQCEIILNNQFSVKSSVPSGISKGPYEAIELRDGGKRLSGQGVLKAIENIELFLAPQFLSKEPNGLEMDMKILAADSTPDKSKLGANATLALSMALYKAQAFSENVELYELIAWVFGSETVSLPFPMFNLINGGLHSNNNLIIQEFMIVPIGLSNFRASMEVAVNVYHELQNILKKMNRNFAIGDEGGIACGIEDDLEALELLQKAIDTVVKNSGSKCVIALDISAERLYNASKKIYNWGGEKLSSEELTYVYLNLLEKYPIYSLEDPFASNDLESWAKLNKIADGKIQIVGDDIFATNMARIVKGLEQKAANATIVKPNQIGTITETLQTIKMCKEVGVNTIVSHRSGETEDNFIADLAVGASAGQIKAGGCARGERIAKYNRLLAIEDKLALHLLNT